MKKIITYLSIITVGLLTTSSAEARTYSPGYNITYVSGYQHCGTPIYTKKVFSHYNSYGKAIFKYHKVLSKVRTGYTNRRGKSVYTPARRQTNRYASNRRSNSRYSYSRR